MSLLGLRRGLRGRGRGDGHARPGQIAELAALAPPDVACVTAIGPVHLELLGTVEAVAAAKAELLQALRPGGTAVVPADEPLLEPHIAALDPGVTVLRVGAAPDLDLDLNLSKAWELRNAAAALACCRAIGHGAAGGRRASRWRSRRCAARSAPLAGGGTLIEDCYNANPIAMRAALADLAGRPGRRVAVLADMMELGPDEARYHREIGEAAAAAAGIDLLVGVGERGGRVREPAPTALEAVHIATVEEAIERVPGLLVDGDVVLLKGSRGDAPRADRRRPPHRGLMPRVLISAISRGHAAHVPGAEVHRVAARQRGGPVRARRRADPGGPRREAGHADHGRPADHRRDGAAVHHPVEPQHRGDAGALRDAGLRGDRLRRRLHEDRQEALARPVGAHPDGGPGRRSPRCS